MTAVDAARRVVRVRGTVPAVAAAFGAQMVGMFAPGAGAVDFPASAPHALACGGTTLQVVSGKIGSEVVWNDPGDGATGGGVSRQFALPSYQASAKVPDNIDTGAPGRGVPDVCGDADPNTGYSVRVDGSDRTIGGTSAVAPLWAGLIARLNQQLAAPTGSCSRGCTRYWAPRRFTTSPPATTAPVLHSSCASQFLCACASLGDVKNVTVSVPDDVYREARIRAAERGSSVSALVAEYLRSLSERDTEFSRLEAQQRQVQDEIDGFSAGDRLDRDQLHARAIS